MIELVKLAAEIQDYIEQNQWCFCFIGGIANLRWGELRSTQDVDLTLFVGFGNENFYIENFLSKFSPRKNNMREFALRNRVLLLNSSEGYPFDVALGALLYEERMISRGSYSKYADDISLYTCCAEDLIITKAFASRDLDWLDIKGIIIRQGKALNWALIKKELHPLCELKEQPEILQRLDDLREKFLQ
jgi:hypothetical protein